MALSTNDGVELFDNARKRTSEPLQSSVHDWHCSKNAFITSALQAGPVLKSFEASSHKLNKHSNKKTIELATGLVNVFPTNNDQSTCCCPMQPQRTTLASRDVAQIFVSQYGADNLAYLQERERREYCSQSPTTDQPSTTLSASSMLSSSAQFSKKDEIANNLANYLTPPSGGLSEVKFLVPFEGIANTKLLESSSDHLPKQPWVTSRMRATTVCWLIEVAMEFNISDEAFHVAISILDRVFRSGVTSEQYQANPDYDWDADFFCVKICELQALGCACIWMGSKLEDKYKLHQENMAFISDYSVTTTTLRNLEFRVFRQLGFSLQCLTPLQYLNAYLRASRACPCRNCEYDHPVLRQMVMYLLCLARVPSDLMDERPSLVVAAALYLARATLGIEDSQTPAYPHKYWSQTLQYYTGYYVSDLCRCTLLIYKYQLQAEELGMAAFDKFKWKSCLKVSLIAARPLEDLGLPAS